MADKGAWFLGGYTGNPPMRGTNGTSLNVASDNLGWALVGWKHELAYNGFIGGAVLDTPVLGDAAYKQIMAFQKANGIVADGDIGPRTGKALLRKRIFAAQAKEVIPDNLLCKLVAQESGFDIGAIGYVDTRDRGPVQMHLGYVGSVSLDKAIRPEISIPFCAATLRSRADYYKDWDVAVASWNVGFAGGDYWKKSGKLASGGRPDLGLDNLYERATAYVTAVKTRTC